MSKNNLESYNVISTLCNHRIENQEIGNRLALIQDDNSRQGSN